jgi:hypothetical protein
LLVATCGCGRIGYARRGRETLDAAGLDAAGLDAAGLDAGAPDAPRALVLLSVAPRYL